MNLQRIILFFKIDFAPCGAAALHLHGKPANLIAGFSMAVLIACATSVRAQSTFDLIQEAQKKLVVEEKELNQVYQEILRDYAKHPEFCKKLRAAQRAWLKFIALHMESKYPVLPGQQPTEGYGSLHSLDLTNERRNLINARIAQLKKVPDHPGMESMQEK